MAVRLVVRHAGGDAEQGDASAAPERVEADLSFEFEQARVAIGRSAGADVRLPHLSVSELHATLLVQGSGYALRDESSTNGTRINGAPLVPGRPRTLESGDEIEIGAFVLSCTLGPMLRGATSAERTASLARRMLRELSPDSALGVPPSLRVVRGKDAGTLVNLAEPPSRCVIGRGEEADLRLDDRDVSRDHVEVVRDLDGVLARDLDSKNGLVVQGKRLRERRLRHGDVITLGATDISFEDPVEAALKGLEGQKDVVITRTLPASDALSAALVATQEPLAASPGPQPALPASPPKTGSPVDVMVYALAGLVLVASVVGLVWLFG